MRKFAAGAELGMMDKRLKGATGKSSKRMGDSANETAEFGEVSLQHLSSRRFSDGKGKDVHGHYQSGSPYRHDGVYGPLNQLRAEKVQHFARMEQYMQSVGQ